MPGAALKFAILEVPEVVVTPVCASAVFSIVPRASAKFTVVPLASGDFTVKPKASAKFDICPDE